MITDAMNRGRGATAELHGLQHQQAKQRADKVKARVLRPFFAAGRPLAVGDNIELPRLDALELQLANKLELLA